MSGFETIAAIAGLAGTAVSAAGTIAAGKAQEQASEFQAKQLDAQGKEETAAAQREALQAKRERDFVLSSQQAAAASGGLGALDTTVQDLAGDITEQSALQTGTITYGGQERAKGRRAQAASSRLEGAAAKAGSKYAAAGTIIGGLGSFAKSFSQPAQSGYKSQYGYA